jgi:hypothetical protein
MCLQGPMGRAIVLRWPFVVAEVVVVLCNVDVP